MLMKTILIKSIFLLMCVSVCLGETQGDRTKDTWTVVDQTGRVFLKEAKTDSLAPIEVNEMLVSDQVLVIGKGASIRLKNPSGQDVVLEGPKKGTLQTLLSFRRTEMGDLVKKTLDKIPAVKGGEKRVKISTQAAGFTRGAKSQRKPMPYIWKVKKSKEKSDKQ